MLNDRRASKRHSAQIRRVPTLLLSLIWTVALIGCLAGERRSAQASRVLAVLLGCSRGDDRRALSKKHSTRFDGMSPEPLIPLARVVGYELTSLEAQLGVRLGAVFLDLEARAVVVQGVGLKGGPRAMLEARLDRRGLRHETHAPDMRLVVYLS